MKIKTLLLPIMGLLTLSTYTYADESDITIKCVVKYNNKILFNNYCTYTPAEHGAYLSNTDSSQNMFGDTNSLYLYKREYHSKNKIGVTAFDSGKGTFSGEYTLSKDRSCIKNKGKEICLSINIDERNW